MVFSCFVGYEGYHKKETLNFEQRMVKELWELLIRKYHSFSTPRCELYTETIICMKEDHRSYRRNLVQKAFFSQMQKLRNFTRLTELKFLIWKNEESLSRFQLG